MFSRPLLPWQAWLAIHAGEMLPDGRPRFRIVLVLVSRQNGKTELLVVLAGYWMFIDCVSMVLGTSTKLEYALETWDKTRKLVERSAQLDDLREPGRKWYVRGNNRIEMWTKDDSRYKIAAANEEGGRSLTIDRLMADELRQHKDYKAWNAAEPAASPHDAQIWATSNAGDDQSVVLNDLRAQALEFIETGEGDYRLGLFEWSAPEDADPTDVDALLQANPRTGYGGKDLETLQLEARRAVSKGGDALNGFLTEKMCIRVKMMNPAVDPTAWGKCLLPGDLANLPRRVLVVDVSPDGQHASLVAAAVMPDGRARVQVMAAWNGRLAGSDAVKALPDWVKRTRAQVVGWFPNGPAAAHAAKLKARPGRPWPPPGVKVEEISGEVSAVCMGFAALVEAGDVVHPGDPLLDAHVGAAERLKSGDTWRFSRKGEGHCDAAYAAAGAVHLARTMPAPLGRPRIVSAAP